VVTLFSSFVRQGHLCLLLEYLPQGDLGVRLANAGRMDIEEVRVYMAETLVAMR
jgi:hypothetical protein